MPADPRNTVRLSRRLDQQPWNGSRSAWMTRTQQVADPGVHARISLSHDRGRLRIQRAWTKLAALPRPRRQGAQDRPDIETMQNAVGISEPDYGVLFADMVLSDASPIRSPFPRTAYRGRYWHSC